MFAVSAFTRRNFAHETGFVSRAGLQCYCRAGWRAGRYTFVGRIWPRAGGCPTLSKSFTYIIKNIGSRIEPCGTPTCIGKIVDVVSSISVYCFMLLR